jgi:hypothetical protein
MIRHVTLIRLVHSAMAVRIDGHPHRRRRGSASRRISADCASVPTLDRLQQIVTIGSEIFTHITIATEPVKKNDSPSLTLPAREIVGSTENSS